MPDGTLQGRHILDVEDEYFLADELNLVLEDAGAETLGPVASVESGLRILQGSTVPDAASLDVNLSGETVYRLADALMARGVPFLFTTGYDPAAIPAPYAHIRCLEKPVALTKVLSELQKLLKEYSHRTIASGCGEDRLLQ